MLRSLAKDRSVYSVSLGASSTLLEFLTRKQSPKINSLRREINLIREILRKKLTRKIRLMYISTADVTNNLKNKSKYVRNKVKIEKIIKKNFNHLLIN